MPQTAIIPVSLSEPARQRATVDWVTQGFYTSTGSIPPGIAYTAAGGSLVWEVGEQNKSIQVTILDTAVPGFFFIQFSNPTAALLGSGVAKVTLQAVASDGGGDTIGGGGGGIVTPPPVSGLAITVGSDPILILGSPLTL